MPVPTLQSESVNAISKASVLVMLFVISIPCMVFVLFKVEGYSIISFLKNIIVKNKDTTTNR